MEIEIQSKPKKGSRKNIRLAAKFFADKLMTKRLHNNVFVSIRFRRRLNERFGYIGVCDNICIEGRPRDFIIDIDDGLSLRQTIRVLAHELVHVKQYATGQLKDYTKSPHKVKWNGDIVEDCLKEYWKTPWEKEAYKMELHLSKSFFAYLKNIN